MRTMHSAAFWPEMQQYRQILWKQKCLNVVVDGFKRAKSVVFLDRSTVERREVALPLANACPSSLALRSLRYTDLAMGAVEWLQRAV